MEEKAQQEPHWPWFFTGVTAPLVRQSTDSSLDSSRMVGSYGWRSGFPPKRAFFSNSVASDRWLCPRVNEDSEALCVSMRISVASKRSFLA